MIPLNELTAETIMSREILEEVFDQEDEIYKAELLASLALRASELRVKTEFKEIVAAYKKLNKELKQKKSQKKNMCLIDNWTNFTDSPYDRMLCKNWIASDDGVYTYNTNSGTTDILACYHPIIPVERLKNLETGEEQLKLAYKRNGRWNEIIVPKTMVTSASKIVSLSGRGIAVTSENAKFLVRYLADVENSNEESIKVQYSSSKLGWIGNGFIPYDTDIVFDGDVRFGQIHESIKCKGRSEEWYKHIKYLRKSKRIEIKFLLAASFASVLVSLLGGLPFFVDLWGDTEGGKTITLMVAASVWADPDNNAYIKDYKGSEVGLEVTCDLLNHLPLILDDSSKKNRRIEENFEGLVYDLCSGKGKTRSDKDLGIRRECHWKNIILTNGEHPLNSYVSQGGAMNRILELEAGNNIYPEPQKTLEILKKNFGHAGKDFINVIKAMGVEEIRKIQKEFQLQLSDDEKMQKQSASLSIVLTADKIATEYLFKDKQYLDVKEAKQVLIDRNELSENERCYRYLMDKTAMNPQRFDLDSTVEKWGIIEKGYVVFFNQAFDELCRSGGFSKKAFLSWANKKALIQTQAGRLNKNKTIDGHTYRCVFLKLEEEPATEGFMDADQIEIPFK